MKPGITALVAAAKTRGELLSVASDVPALVKDWRAGQVSSQVKRTLGMAVVGVLYILSPIDLLPEAILPVIGLADDALVAAWTLNGLIEAVQLHRRQSVPVTAESTSVPESPMDRFRKDKSAAGR